jgi:hypothetical protein
MKTTRRSFLALSNRTDEPKLQLWLKTTRGRFYFYESLVRQWSEQSQQPIQPGDVGLMRELVHIGLGLDLLPDELIDWVVLHGFYPISNGSLAETLDQIKSALGVLGKALLPRVKESEIKEHLWILRLLSLPEQLAMARMGRWRLKALRKNLPNLDPKNLDKLTPREVVLAKEFLSRIKGQDGLVLGRYHDVRDQLLRKLEARPRPIPWWIAQEPGLSDLEKRYLADQYQWQRAGGGSDYTINWSHFRHG